MSYIQPPGLRSGSCAVFRGAGRGVPNPCDRAALGLELCLCPDVSRLRREAAARPDRARANPCTQ